MKLVVGTIYSELHPPHTTREDRDVFRLSFERVQIFKSNKRRWLIGLNLLQITAHTPVSRNSSLTRSLLTAARMWIKAARWLWIQSETSSRAPLKNKKSPIWDKNTSWETFPPSVGDQQRGRLSVLEVKLKQVGVKRENDDALDRQTVFFLVCLKSSFLFPVSISRHLSSQLTELTTELTA